jgi:rubrerythrin
MSGIAEANAITFENLAAAFEGESDARDKYVAFAAKADEEELHGVASLFRAVARSEQIHAANHAHVINQVGRRAECVPQKVEVNSTLENLKTALNGEKFEIDILYPGFLEEATEHKLIAAIRSFTGALEAERTHARLFSEAIALLAAGKKDSPIGTWLSEAREFYVCPVCGYTSETEEEHERCPVCSCPWEKFEIIR